MKTLGYYNGKFGPLEEMTVPMNDRACYFGDGVYEATLARNGKIFALKEHLDRFFNSAGLIKIDIPYTKDELAAILYDMLAKMDDKDIFIYWQMTRVTGIRQHTGDCQCVGSVISLSGKYDNAGLFGIAAAKFTCKYGCRAFYQVDRADRFVLNGIFIELSDFVC